MEHRNYNLKQADIYALTGYLVRNKNVGCLDAIIRESYSNDEYSMFFTNDGIGIKLPREENNPLTIQAKTNEKLDKFVSRVRKSSKVKLKDIIEK
jgi:hypothetical protein